MATYAVITEEAPDARVGITRVDTDDIVSKIQTLAGDLGRVFETESELPLKSMAVALAITAEGQIGFLGTGAKAGTEASITLTFER